MTGGRASRKRHNSLFDNCLRVMLMPFTPDPFVQANRMPRVPIDRAAAARYL